MPTETTPVETASAADQRAIRAAWRAAGPACTQGGTLATWRAAAYGTTLAALPAQRVAGVLYELADSRPHNPWWTAVTHAVADLHAATYRLALLAGDDPGTLPRAGIAGYLSGRAGTNWDAASAAYAVVARRYTQAVGAWAKAGRPA